MVLNGLWIIAKNMTFHIKANKKTELKVRLWGVAGVQCRLLLVAIKYLVLLTTVVFKPKSPGFELHHF